MSTHFPVLLHLYSMSSPGCCTARNFVVTSLPDTEMVSGMFAGTMSQVSVLLLPDQKIQRVALSYKHCSFKHGSLVSELQCARTQYMSLSRWRAKYKMACQIRVQHTLLLLQTQGVEMICLLPTCFLGERSRGGAKDSYNLIPRFPSTMHRYITCRCDDGDAAIADQIRHCVDNGLGEPALGHAQ
jgi:hypothetical protein